MLALLLRETRARTAFHTLNQHLGGEYRAARVFVLCLVQLMELHFHTVLLAPFQKLRLEVDLLVGYLVDVDQLG